MEKRRRTREDWTAAALAALAEGGLAAVAVEALASRVGATKGSAYWHFPNREALLRATLERWEAERTEAVIAVVEAESDPAVRLRVLFRSAMVHADGNAIELALLASADDPVVAPIMRRVTERRIGYLAALFGGLGFSPERAKRRAVVAYTVYLGHAQLARTLSAALPSSADALRAHLDDTLRMLLSPVDEG